MFGSVLSVLSLAEHGVSNTIAYSMYQSVSEGDADYVCALPNVYIVVPNLIFIIYSASKQTKRYIGYGIAAVAGMMERS